MGEIHGMVPPLNILPFPSSFADFGVGGRRVGLGSQLSQKLQLRPLKDIFDAVVPMGPPPVPDRLRDWQSRRRPYGSLRAADHPRRTAGLGGPTRAMNCKQRDKTPSKLPPSMLKSGLKDL